MTEQNNEETNVNPSEIKAVKYIPQDEAPAQQDQSALGEPASSAAKAPAPKNAPKHFWRRLMYIAVLLVFIVGAFLTVKSVYMDNDQFDVTFYRVGSDKLKSNMRTVLVSDLHMKQYGKDNAELLDAIRRLNPDFISVAGDINTYGAKNTTEFICEFCTELVKIAPTYYVLGNHEMDEILHNKIDLKARIEETGVILLSNQSIETTINGNAVVIGGLTQRYEEREKYAPHFMEKLLEKQGFRILLTHYPQSFLQGLQDENIDLAMCGHAHGGHIRLPLIGAMYTPDQGLMPKLTEGQHEYEFMNLIISRGLGDSGGLPRINNKPELVVVDMSTY